MRKNSEEEGSEKGVYKTHSPIFVHQKIALKIGN
jgi:hypothetical protein